MAVKRQFKTAEICGFFDVTRVTVIDWIKNGKLTAYETGGGHYRVMREDLIDFFKQKNRPLPDELKSESEKHKKYKILIVDDEKNSVEFIKMVLDDLGVDLEIQAAYDGLEAGFKVAHFLPHLVILDALMPGFNGDQVCALVRGNRILKDTKILGFTAFDEGKDKLLKAGADKVIIKAGPESDVYIFRKEVCKLLGVELIKVSTK